MQLRMIVCMLGRGSPGQGVRLAAQQMILITDISGPVNLCFWETVALPLIARSKVQTQDWEADWGFNCETRFMVTRGSQT